MLRPLEERDLEAVRRLRNENRDWFFDDREISVEQQRAWFAGLSGSDCRFFVIEEDGVVVGTISVTDSAAGVEIGNLVLAQSHRGRGLMHEAVTQLSEGRGDYFARVKPGNESSVQVFRKAGFSTEYVVFEKRVDP